MRTFILAVTGLALGITACSSSDGTTVVIQKTPVASVSVTLPSSSLIAGQTQRGVATAHDASGAALPNRPVAWQSSSPSIASVSESGMIAAVAPGTVVVSAASEGVSGQAAMTVTAASPVPVGRRSNCANGHATVWRKMAASMPMRLPSLPHSCNTLMAIITIRPSIAV